MGASVTRPVKRSDVGLSQETNEEVSVKSMMEVLSLESW